MRVYYIANVRIPSEKAHGIQLAKMCEAFVQKGVDLELVVPKRKNVIKQSVEEFYGLKCRVPIKKLPILNFGVSNRLTFNLTSLSFAISSFFYLLLKKARGQKGIAYTIDLDQFSFFLIRISGFPYFAEFHDAKKGTWFYRFFLKNISGLITINQLIKEKIVEIFNLSPEKIIVQPNGIDLDFFSKQLSKEQARQILELPEDKYIVTYVGKFYLWKGLEILSLASAYLDKQVVLYLVGGTKNQFEAVVNKELSDNIVCVGEKNFKEIPLWLAASDALLVLGTGANEYSFYYTSPMKIFEYMAFKRPIIASQTPANSQIVGEEEVFFYEPDNALDLAKKIEYVWLHNNLAGEKAEKSFLKISNYSWENRTSNILQFIKNNLN